MSREVTEADLLTAEKIGGLRLNDLREMLQDKVTVEQAEEGMNAILAITNDMTPAQRVASALWIIMKEMLDHVLPNDTQGEAS